MSAQIDRSFGKHKMTDRLSDPMALDVSLYLRGDFIAKVPMLKVSQLYFNQSIFARYVTHFSLHLCVFLPRVG